jgi:hypothetical protein
MTNCRSVARSIPSMTSTHQPIIYRSISSSAIKQIDALKASNWILEPLLICSSLPRRRIGPLRIGHSIRNEPFWDAITMKRKYFCSWISSPILLP